MRRPGLLLQPHAQPHFGLAGLVDCIVACIVEPMGSGMLSWLKRTGRSAGGAALPGTCNQRGTGTGQALPGMPTVRSMHCWLGGRACTGVRVYEMSSSVPPRDGDEEAVPLVSVTLVVFPVCPSCGAQGNGNAIPSIEHSGHLPEILSGLPSSPQVGHTT